MSNLDFDEKKGLVLSWKEGNKTKAMPFSQIYEGIISESKAISHKTHGSNIYQQVYQGNISIRDEFTSADYEAYRPTEALPKSSKARIKAAMVAYYEHGIIRNIIDLMGDFAVQGIDIVHPKKRTQNWFRKWWKIVKGKERSERLGNYLARMANVIVKRETGTISVKQTKQLQKTTGASGDKFEIPSDKFSLDTREIPRRYIFLNPLTLEVIGEDLNTFVDPDNIAYGLRLSANLMQKIANPSNDSERALIQQLPKDIVNKVRKGETLLPLERDKIRAIFYKKDDWDTWATPIICSILPELITLQKMKLADRSALDGVISQLRVWKLGDVKEKIWPSAGAINKLAGILMNAVGGGVVDIVWGPDLQLQETTATLHNFLGETKYTPILNAIYAGLGVPPLFSGSTDQGGFTNNFLAIKTLIERLEYIRERIVEFWQVELELVSKAMGFEESAYIVFDRMTLNDEASILQIIAGMVDRGIISDEYAQEMVGAVPEIENFRLRRESNERKSGRRSAKAGAFHNPLTEHELKKIALQSGVVTPSEVGLELEEKKPNEKNSLEFQKETQIQVAKFKPKGVSGQGRPRSSKDKKKRKTKQVKPRQSVKATLSANLMWAEDAQIAIADKLTPIYLKSINKKNMRQLTEKEAKDFEKLKFRVLMNLPVGDTTESTIAATLAKPLGLPEFVDKLLAACTKNYSKKFNKEEITIEQQRRIQSIVCAFYNSDRLDDLNTANTDITSPLE